MNYWYRFKQNNRINLTVNRIGSFGIVWRSTPILPLLTANNDVKVTKLSCGFGNLLWNKKRIYF